MTIRIQTEKPSIPIDFGALKFEFDTTDESVKRFYDGIEIMQAELAAIEPQEGNEIEAAKEALKKGYDYMLGEGAFEKIYEQTPSVMKLVGYFQQLSESIAEKLSNMGLSQSQKQKVDKYLNHKKRNNRNPNRKK